MPKFTQWWQPW